MSPSPSLGVAPEVLRKVSVIPAAELGHDVYIREVG